MSLRRCVSQKQAHPGVRTHIIHSVAHPTQAKNDTTDQSCVQCSVWGAGGLTDCVVLSCTGGHHTSYPCVETESLVADPSAGRPGRRIRRQAHNPLLTREFPRKNETSKSDTADRHCCVEPALGDPPRLIIYPIDPMPTAGADRDRPSIVSRRGGRDQDPRLPSARRALPRDHRVRRISLYPGPFTRRSLLAVAAEQQRSRP